MKKIIYAFILSFLTTSCLNDSFMERYPLGSPSSNTVFVSYDNFRTYAWGLYETFPALGYGEIDTDNISYNSVKESGESSWIRGLYVPPVSTNNTAWAYYSFIRRVNLMLDNIDSSNMSDTEKAHWRSVGYFFRAYRYFSLLSAYGGVPWVDHVLADNESEIIYGKRETRDFISNKILEELKYAEKNINVDGDGENTINKNVVQALLSRFTLFEGTWRKYHGLDSSDLFLNECKRVSGDLLTRVSTIHYSYDDLFNSISLKGIDGILLYKPYNNQAGVIHATSILGTTALSYYNVTKDMVNSYLCSDGKPCLTSSVYKGDKDIYSEFDERDMRMLLQVTPPYRVDRSESSHAWDTKWKYTSNPIERKYIDIVKELPKSSDRQKVLPFRQGYVGGILGTIPHFTFYNEGQPWYISSFGYNSWKYYNCHLDEGSVRNEETDMPIFRIEEVMLNYAEAMVELGEFTQDIADKTINVLRSRVNVSPMIVSEITEDFDPVRDKGDKRYKNDYEVSPILWEVRRERRVELFSEGFRFDDLRRWKKCHYSLKKKLGQWVNLNAFPEGTDVSVDGGGYEGYLEFHPEQTHLWPDYYYLYPIPTGQIVLNPNLEQNPGW